MRLRKYWQNIQLDLRLFALILLVITLYRIVFMWQMSGYMSEGGAAEIPTALWAGLRLSLKTAGGVALLSFALATLTNVAAPRWNTAKIRWGVGILAVFLLSVLFEGRFPYYREFGMTYHLQVMQGFYDDKAAIFWTMAEEYALFPRLAAATLLTAVWGAILLKCLRLPTTEPPAFLAPSEGTWRKVIAAFCLAAITFLFALFARFGGSFGYEGGINWENAALTRDNFLNECILDDVQALYRAKENAKRMAAGEIAGVERDKVREWAAKLSGDPNMRGDDLTPYLTRTAAGAKLPRPEHIFIILGESWANWPILDEYAFLGVAEGIKSLRAEENAFFTHNFMPNGDFTSIAITGMITGLSEVATRVNYQPRSFEEPYITAMAKPFHELGYKVDFWYGGVPAWDNINRLALAQGFDHFYGYVDYDAPKQSTWGTADGYMFDALEAHLKDEPPTVHLIMTVSNHPPYNLDLEALGLDLAALREKTRRMPKVDNPDELATELGHYWYMDRETTRFIREVSGKYLQSLFVLTGDHAVRTNPSATPTMFEQQGIPFLIYGAGVTKDLLPPETVGGHTYIVPTILELIAPAGFRYQSISPSMTQKPAAAFNRDYWLTSRAMGQVAGDAAENLPKQTASDFAAEKAKAWELIAPLRTLSWQLITHGSTLSKN